MKVIRTQILHGETIRIVMPETDSDFENYYHLRWKELRAPWGQPKGSEKDSDEKSSVHFALVNSNNEWIGVCRLQKNSQTEAQVRYMAVRRDHQHRHLGDLLLKAAEEKALDLKCNYIILHSREKAITFYERNGYAVQEKTYLMFNEVQHFLMRKNL